MQIAQFKYFMFWLYKNYNYFVYLQINSPNKYSSTILNWPDSNTLMQLCEKQGFQTINIPAYSQNNTVLNVQSHNLPMRIIPNMYAPHTDSSHEKQDVNNMKSGSDESNCGTVSIYFIAC